MHQRLVVSVLVIIVEIKNPAVILDLLLIALRTDTDQSILFAALNIR